jgi:hypothetical protein
VLVADVVSIARHQDLDDEPALFDEVRNAAVTLAEP